MARRDGVWQAAAVIALLIALQAAPAIDMPPAPPPQPIVDCFAPGPFIVFFDRNASLLDREARYILARFAEVERDGCAGAFRFSITGHADDGERAGVDVRRARAVRAFAAAHGLRAMVGPVRGIGTSVPRVLRPSPDQRRQNQRIEIDALPGG